MGIVIAITGIALVASVWRFRSQQPIGRGLGLLWSWALAELLATILLPWPGEVPWQIRQPYARWVSEEFSLPADAGLPPPPESTPLIAFMGDSFTHGQGALQHESLPARVSEALAADGVEVRNLGAAGSEFFDQLVRYALLDVELAPDVLVWSFVLNDLEFGYDAHDAISVRGELAARGPTPLLGAMRRARAQIQYGEDMEPVYRATFDPDGPAWQEFSDGLRRLVASSADRDARFVFVIWPLLYRLDDYPFADIHAQLASEAERSGAEVLDLLPLFVGRDERELWAHPLDHHPNAGAYAEAAEALLTLLRERPIPTSGPWRCDGTPLLVDKLAPLERRWCTDRSPDALARNSETLAALHQAQLAEGKVHAMLGRVPMLLRIAAMDRRAHDDVNVRRQDLRAIRAFVTGPRPPPDSDEGP